MKQFLIYTIYLICFMPAMAEDLRFEEANTYFSEEKYEEAINTYEEILSSNVESAEIYYNLGNAYYKTGQLPKAILNFERALLLSPHDKDIRHNLEMVNTQITDKLETVGKFFLAEWFNNFKSITKSDTWAIISIITFGLFVFLIGVFFFSGQRVVKQISFFVGILLFFASFFAFNFSGAQKNKLVHRDSAIIFDPSVSIKSSPSTGGKDLFILHEGTKVKILENLREWKRIQISDGNEGWVHSSSIEMI
ncbi:tetratricopeptide repeat protein [Labilibacter sediminis]|nr:tetratricopeptide repeat protein [Labilibacter sediminis]